MSFTSALTLVSIVAAPLAAGYLFVKLQDLLSTVSPADHDQFVAG
ncbi:MAG: hypothetical protein AB7L76_09875 [Burkholderiaceae bacterium]